jgi:hypothetical protein
LFFLFFSICTQLPIPMYTAAWERRFFCPLHPFISYEGRQVPAKLVAIDAECVTPHSSLVSSCGCSTAPLVSFYWPRQLQTGCPSPLRPKARLVWTMYGLKYMRKYYRVTVLSLDAMNRSCTRAAEIIC